MFSQVFRQTEQKTQLILDVLASIIVHTDEKIQTDGCAKHTL
ncbi:MAG: hypothetical protein PHG19_00910 [Anaerotignum sp.]|nr:hypothetical protein [Anaerotignum sp.]